jgi:hypothetical protein
MHIDYFWRSEAIDGAWKRTEISCHVEGKENQIVALIA